jgi:hypothetical protein
MKRHARLVPFAVLALACCAAAARAQRPDEYVPLPTLSLKRESVLREGHTPRTASLQRLPPGTTLERLTQRERGGYYFVSTREGVQGWVWARNVARETAPSALAARAPTAAAARGVSPCGVESFDACTDSGCADPSDPHDAEEALLNERKRARLDGDAQDAVPLTIADFDALQKEAQQKVGRASGQFSQEERDKLTDLHAAAGTVHEGSLVRFAGFIALSTNRPEVSGGESVNCGFSAAAQSDFHIPVAGRRGDTEFRGVVIEMIPQQRPAGWTMPKLKAIQRDRRRILVVGALLYDSAHRVNKDSRNAISNQPPRRSVWEIHPVSRFLVCKARGSAAACDPARADDWTPLEAFTP